jgi:hypothetical protein
VIAAIHSFAHNWVDYVVHFGIDVAGTLATLYAQRFVKAPWHQFLVWLSLSLLVTITTVNVVG